jgi:hypothetical protein
VNWIHVALALAPVGSFERGNELQGSIKYREYLNYLSDDKILGKGLVFWNYSVDIINNQVVTLCTGFEGYKPLLNKDTLWDGGRGLEPPQCS